MNKERNYIKIYEDGEIDFNIKQEFNEVHYLKDDTRVKLSGSGISLDITIIGETYSPNKIVEPRLEIITEKYNGILNDFIDSARARDKGWK